MERERQASWRSPLQTLSAFIFLTASMPPFLRGQTGFIDRLSSIVLSLVCSAQAPAQGAGHHLALCMHSVNQVASPQHQRWGGPAGRLHQARSRDHSLREGLREGAGTLTCISLSGRGGVKTNCYGDSTVPPNPSTCWSPGVTHAQDSSGSILLHPL